VYYSAYSNRNGIEFIVIVFHERQDVQLTDAAMCCFRPCKKWDSSAFTFVDKIIAGLWILCVHVRVLLGWLCMQRLVWQSAASAEASFHSGLMCNPVCEKCLYVWVMHGYYCSESACFVSVTALCYVYSAQWQLQVSLDARPLRHTPNRHWATQSHLPSLQGHVTAGWCYGDSMRCTRPSIYLLSVSLHLLQLRRSYSWV